MAVFCTHCGAELGAGTRHCTQCGSTVPESKDRRWLWWVPALILFFALGYWLAHLFAPKCPSCEEPADGAGQGRSARASGSGESATGAPKNSRGAPGQGPAESAGGSSTGDIDGSGKITPHDLSGKIARGDNTSHKPDDGDPAPDNVFRGGNGDSEFYGTVGQLAYGITPGDSTVKASDDPLAAHTKSLVAPDFTYDKTNLPRYPDNVRYVASSISYALDAKTREHTGAYGTGAGITTNSSFDDVVAWYQKNLPAGWQNSSIGDFSKLAQPIQGPGGDLMKLLKGEMPGATPASAAGPAAPKVRVALFKPPNGSGASPASSIMIMQKDDKPVTVYLQTQVH